MMQGALILRNDTIEFKLKAKLQPWTAVSTLLGLFSTVVSALHHCLLVFLCLAHQIFYRSYVDRQHFRLRSFASLCS